uniref:AlNc14C293G10261 protein n=1 Tax=Albugo laibachii Nc14 TaxID=890382 RepID=F0WVB7_9STRA|nr:AlNc14C293G10261 [Albugo laibachii Nc14]|eukprot:CCA25356.1 AlNc14C293G10261 [Albugo laibachii Nc14]
MKPNKTASRKGLSAGAPINYVLDVESFLKSPEMHCLKVTNEFARGRSCIHCIARTIQSPVLFVSISYTEMTILAHDFSIQTLRKVKYLDSHEIYPKFYSEVVKMKAPASWTPACLLVHANFHSSKQWWNCLRNQLEKYVKIKAHATSNWTLLLWTGQPGITDSTPFQHAVWECRTKKSVSKLIACKTQFASSMKSFDNVSKQQR